MGRSHSIGLSPASARPARWAVLAACAAIVAGGALAYHNSFRVPFEFDDVGSIINNPTIRRLWPAGIPLRPPAGGKTVAGRPILNLSLAVNYAISGPEVWSYHALNLAIHLLAGLTLFGVVRRTLATTARSRSRQTLANERSGQTDGQNLTISATITAFIVALLWTVHPLQTESVTYVVQRAESLAGLFYLLALYGFIRGAEQNEVRRVIPNPPENDGERGRSERRVKDPSSPRSAAASNAPCLWFALSWLACLFGMATKEVMVTAPLMILLYDRTFNSGSFLQACRRRLWYYAALAATWLELAYLIAADGGNRGGTIGFGVSVTWSAYVLTQFRAVVRYLRLCFWPHPLIFDYGTYWVRGAAEVLPDALPILLLLAGTVWLLFRQDRAGRGLGFLGAWFFGILAPTSLAPGTTQMLVEHRLYLPLAAVMVLVVLGIYRAIEVGTRGSRVPPSSALALLCCLPIAAGFGYLTLRRNQVYRSEISIWSDSVAKQPDNADVHNNLGVALERAGRTQEALEHYRRAIQFMPASVEAHFNLGLLLALNGRVDEGIRELEETVRLSPDYPRAHYNLGVELMQRGRFAEAIAAEQRAVELEPNFAGAHASLANALDLAGRSPEAIAEDEAALRLEPGLAEAHANLGLALLHVRRPAEALHQLQTALRLGSAGADLRNHLGVALAALERPGEAADQFAAALRLAPDNAEAHDNLGTVLAQSGRMEAAAAEYQTALRLQPNLAGTRANLGIILFHLGRPAEARDQFLAVLRRGPDSADLRNHLGVALAALGQLAGARDQFAAAVRLDPGDAEARDNLERAQRELSTR